MGHGLMYWCNSDTLVIDVMVPPYLVLVVIGHITLQKV